jgi:hypothetical protein
MFGCECLMNENPALPLVELEKCIIFNIEKI